MQKEYLSAAAEVLSDQGVDENLGLRNDEKRRRGVQIEQFFVSRFFESEVGVAERL